MQTQNLQIIPRGIKPIIKASQFDVGREFQLKLYDGAVAYTPPTGTTLRLDGAKPDGTVFSYTENLSLSGSTITVTTTTQMTILEGTVMCEIRMTKDNEDIGTINFDLMVEKSPINETTDLSQTEIPALVTLARMQMENAEAWAVGTKDGEPVSPDDPQYENSAKYWAQQVGGETQDAEAWAVGTKDGVPVTSDDPQYHNNAKYYSDGVQAQAEAAAASATSAASSATSASNAASNAASSATAAGNAADRAEAAVVLEPYIGANGNWFVYDFSTNAYVDTGVEATGATGNGIVSVAKTSTSGLVDTYTITYTNGTTSTFTVTNGEDGAPGATGNGIVSITKTSTSGLVDTYTILYTNGTTSTFTVTNGQNGTGAGDMLSADYDPTQAVFNAGGIVAYVASQISGLSTSLSGLTDVALTSLAAGQSLVYDATAQKWVNGSVSSSNVNYTNTTSGLTATNAQDAIDEVAAENQTLTNKLDAEIETRAKTGAHNWLPLILSRIKALNTTGTWNNNVYSINNLTITFNDDLSIFVSGTPSANTELQLSDMFSLPAGVDFVMEGTPASGGVNKYWWYLKNRTPSDTAVKNMNPTESGNVLHFTADATNHYYRAQLYIWASQAINETFYPLICLASDPSTSYAPYAMTNRELTEILSDVGTYNVPVIMGSAQSNYVRGAIPYHDKTAKHTVTINSVKQFADSTDYTSQFSVDYSTSGFAIIYSSTVALAGALMNVDVTIS